MTAIEAAVLDVAVIIFGLAMVYVIVANGRPAPPPPEPPRESMEAFLERTATEHERQAKNKNERIIQ